MSPWPQLSLLYLPHCRGNSEGRQSSSGGGTSRNSGTSSSSGSDTSGTTSSSGTPNSISSDSGSPASHRQSRSSSPPAKHALGSSPGRRSMQSMHGLPPSRDLSWDPASPAGFQQPKPQPASQSPLSWAQHEQQAQQTSPEQHEHQLWQGPTGPAEAAQESEGGAVELDYGYSEEGMGLGCALQRVCPAGAQQAQQGGRSLREPFEELSGGSSLPSGGDGTAAKQQPLGGGGPGGALSTEKEAVGGGQPGGKEALPLHQEEEDDQEQEQEQEHSYVVSAWKTCETPPRQRQLQLAPGVGAVPGAAEGADRGADGGPGAAGRASAGSSRGPPAGGLWYWDSEKEDRVYVPFFLDSLR
jgi:hypothetical protein